MKKFKNPNDHGVAFIEMSVTLAVSVLLLLSIVDIGIVLNRYVDISRIAYEGVRMASDQSRLTSNTKFLSCKGLAGIYSDCASEEEAPLDQTHRELHEKIKLIIHKYNLEMDQFSIESYRERVDDKDVVKVQIISPLPRLFNSFLKDSLVVSSRYEGPYLQVQEDEVE